MFADERRQVILELVRAQGAVAIKELARIVQTSEVTVRRDLRVLESGGLIDRRHGGAVAAGALAREPTHSEKAHQAAREKAAIAAVAAGLVAEGDVITIGAGTTTQAFARRLTRLAELTVMTNSLLVAHGGARAHRDRRLNSLRTDPPGAVGGRRHACAVRRRLTQRGERNAMASGLLIIS